MPVQLRSIDRDNWRQAAALEITDEQWGFLDSESILHFLVEGQFHPTYSIYAAYHDDVMVGLLSVGYLPDDPEKWWIPLLLIDHRHQRRGFGREVLHAVIEQTTREASEAKAIGLSYKPENVVAANLYRSAGFIEAGTGDRGEIVAWRTLRTEKNGG